MWGISFTVGHVPVTKKNVKIKQSPNMLIKLNAIAFLLRTKK